MSKLYYRRSSGKPRVMLATPVIGQPVAGYTHSLFHTAIALEKAGIQAEYCLLQNDCHVDDSRNAIVERFLNSRCEYLFFIDSDIEWEPHQLIRILSHEKAVCAGIYPFKEDNPGYPVAYLPGETKEADGLIEVLAVPTGFLCIHADVLADVARSCEWFKPKETSTRKLPLIFERKVDGGLRRGGDYQFCKLARCAGYSIFVDPNIDLAHVGENAWRGNLSHESRVQRFDQIGAGLLEIAHGRMNHLTLSDMIRAWGNEAWRADEELLTALASVKSPGPILECGSGLSTLVLAAKNPDQTVTCLEHDPAWAIGVAEAAERYGLKNIQVTKTRLVNGWYDEHLTGSDWGMILIDGPPRDLSNRAEIVNRVNFEGAIVIADDAQDPEYSSALSVALNNHKTAITEGQNALLIARPEHNDESKTALYGT